MLKLKKGDIVGRKSYNHDIKFYISELKEEEHQKIAILKGITIRIEATAPLEDLEKIDKKTIEKDINKIEKKINSRVIESKIGASFPQYNGTILHLDGDRNYSKKSYRYYKKLSLNAIVKNIPESKQSFYIRGLLDKYRPDILVITGHDAILKKNLGYHNIHNYKNSANFVKTVKEARKWNHSVNGLVIFAGACQSYYEAIMEAGANFASSPGRILIDFVDPLIVANKIATTSHLRYVTVDEICKDTTTGYEGIGGISTRGKKK